MPPRLLSPLDGNLNDNLNYNVERRPGRDEADLVPTPSARVVGPLSLIAHKKIDNFLFVRTAAALI